jgi:hypothetical protein
MPNRKVGEYRMMDAKTECAKCTKVVCNSEQFDQGPSNCPTKAKAGAIR